MSAPAAAAAAPAEPAKESTTTTTTAAQSAPGGAPAAAAVPPAAPAAPAAAATSSEPAKEPPKADPPVVPETYDLKVPEGSPLDAAAIESFSSFAKEQGLTQQQAQALLERENAATLTSAGRPLEEFKAKAQGWETELKADKEIGGASFEKTKSSVDRFLDRFFPAEHVKALRDAGHGATYGLPPWIYRGFASLAKATGNDTLVREGADTPNSDQPRHADVLYPSLQKQQS